MSFSADAWKNNADIYTKIIEMPFNQEMISGKLNSKKFQFYMVQDAHYLIAFSKSLSILASKAQVSEEIIQFAEAAKVAIVVERSLHETYFQRFGLTRSDVENIEMSPVCDHYVNFLLATTTNNSYEVGVATILPCFWIYAEVGKHIYHQSVGKNPYLDWIDSYASEEFEESVNHVIKTTDHAAADASKTTIKMMHHVFRRATQLEWMFWDSAYQMQSWPV